LRAGRRDAAREVVAPAGGGAEPPPDRDPTPAEAAALVETLERWLRGLSPGERTITELGLQGYAAPDIAERLGRTERSVRRSPCGSSSSPAGARARPPCGTPWPTTATASASCSARPAGMPRPSPCWRGRWRS